MSPAFLDIVAAFALFRRSAINLLIIVILLHNTVLPLFLSCASTLSPSYSYTNCQLSQFINLLLGRQGIKLLCLLVKMIWGSFYLGITHEQILGLFS